MSLSGVIGLLSSDYASLAKEAGRRHSDVRDAADKATQLIKQSKEQALLDLTLQQPQPTDSTTSSSSSPPVTTPPPILYQPIFLASTTRNAKVIALATSALQRLISAGAVPKSIVSEILSTLERILPQGVEIQLKILQTLVGLLTTKVQGDGNDRKQPLVRGEELGQALELSHRLSTSKIPVVASTASATLRQLFMFVYERISEEDQLVEQSSDPDRDPLVPRATFDVDVPPVEEDRAKDLQVDVASVTGDENTTKKDGIKEGESKSNEMRSIKLRPAARDAYLLLEDLCLLIAGNSASTSVDGGGGEGGPDGEPSFLRWTTLSRTFGLELVESIVSGFGPVVRTHPELLLVLRAHLCPLLIRFLSHPPSSSNNSSSSSSTTFSFPLTLRLTRVIFLLVKQFSDLLTLESEVFLTMFIRIIAPADSTSHSNPSNSTNPNGGGGGSHSSTTFEGGHPAGPGLGTSPLWMRVLALEIFRGLCGDFGLMIKFYQRYDAAAVDSNTTSSTKKVEGGGGSTVFSDLMTAFNRLATEKPSALGTGNAVLYGSSMTPSIDLRHHHSNQASVSISNVASAGGGTGSAMIDSAMEMGLGLAHAAGSVVGSGAAAVASAAAASSSGSHHHQIGLNATTASLKLQCIDQLDKADAPAIPETYIFLLALQCLAALADGFSTYTLATYSTILDSRNRSQPGAPSPTTAPSALDWKVLDEERSKGSRQEDPKITSLRIVKEMAETSWPALLASLSFFIATSLSDDLFIDVVTALQSLTCVCGVLDLSIPREAFLTSLCKFAIPPGVVSHVVSQDTLSRSGPTSSTTSSSSAAAIAATTTAVLSAGAESLGLTSSSSSSPVGLASRNLACLRALLAVSNFLAGSLGKTWYSVLEALQNADFVLRATASKGGKKRNQPTTNTTTTTDSKTSSSTTGGANGGEGGTEATTTTRFPAIPSEADEQAVQRGIAALFEVSKALDDGAFAEFVAALCRLNGEMVGMAMNEDGTVKEEEFGVHGRSGIVSPLETPEKNRRRSSGISIKSQKLSEKSFGISKLGVVALFNIYRLVLKDPSLGWNLVTSHLLIVLHSTSVPTSIRLQAADVLDSILILAPKNLSSAPLDVQQRAQTQILSVLAAQAEPAPRLQSSTDVDIRRMALESLLKILETNGHGFTVGWDRIFHVLRTACPTSQFFAPPSPQPPSHSDSSSRKSLDTIVESDRLEPMTPLRLGSNSGGYFPSERTSRTSVLVRTSFPCLQLICSDFLGGLAVEDLRDCIGTLAEFGKQSEDVNVALTAGGLLWSVSDHVQAKRKEDETAHSDLWMFLLHRLLSLCRDPRQEVRDAAITNIFRSISMYGTTLSKETWDACCWEIIFPLVEDVTTTIESQSFRDEDDLSLAEEATVPQAHGPPIRLVDKQWDDSKTLVLRSIGDVFFDYLPQIVKTDRYEETWRTLVDHFRQSFVRDRPLPATAAMQSFEKILTVSLESTEASRIASSWEVAWTAWDDIGQSIEDATPEAKVFTQVNLEAFVRVVLPIYTPPYISFPLARISRLLSILKSVLRYARSPDYRPDIDGLMPLQSAILEVVAVIKLDEVPGAASAVLSDLADYLTFAFVAPFESRPEGNINGRQKQVQSVTYIALTKEVMPHVLWLFQKYHADPSVYEQGAVERMLLAYSIPLRLKHDCPAPAKFGSAEPLWKSATVNFLKGVRVVVAALRSFGTDLPPDRFVGTWKAIVEGFRGALLAETGSAVHASLDELYREENFDLALLLSLEQDVLPYIGSSLVPDDLIRSLGKTLQLASRLYELDVPRQRKDRILAHKRSFASSLDRNETLTPPPTPPEPRFDSDFDRQARSTIRGTTVEVIEADRERFAFWSFDLLFSLCAATEQGELRERRRIAALCLPSLMNRCAATIKTYVADAPLRGKMPFPRIRQEELSYVLQQLVSLRLGEGTLWASTQTSPSQAIDSRPILDSSLPLPTLIRSTLLRSPLAHLYEFHPLLTALLSHTPSLVSATTRSTLPHRHVASLDSNDGLPSGFKVERIGSSPSTEVVETDLLKLVLSALELVGGEIGAGSSF